MGAELLLLAVVVLGAYGAGIYFAGSAIDAALGGNGKRFALRGALAAVFVLLPTWVCASVWATVNNMEVSEKCRMAMRTARDGLDRYANEHHGEGLPGRWPLAEEEPLCPVPGAPQPFVYLPVSDFQKTVEQAPRTWIAYSPRIRVHYWWAPWYDLDARLVLHAEGWTEQLSEQEFQRSLGAAGGPR